MAYDPLTGRYTPDPVKPSNFTYGQGNPLSNVYVPPASTTRATPGQFRRAEDTSNQGAPAYTPTPLTETGEFVEAAVDPNAGFTSVGNQAFFQGKPYNGMRNGIQFINGYRQDLYTPDGKDREPGTKNGLKTEAQIAAEETAAGRRAERQSAYDLLYSQFKQYGLESLVEPLKGLITTGVSPSEFTIKLRESDVYKKRFAGNAARIQKGFRALDEAEYIALEDQYQNVMRNYGLPSSYYEKGQYGVQPGFTNLIAGNVSASELEERVQRATDFMDKGPKAYVDAIKQFYPEISRGDLLAYVLDPENALTKINAKIGAAKIGGEYLRAGLGTDVNRAEFLQREGVTGEAARQGAQAVLNLAPRGSMLADIYKTGPYGQAEVEEEVYGLAGAAEAKKLREKITKMENASFSGGAGTAQGALGRERAMGQGQI